MLSFFRFFFQQQHNSFSEIKASVKLKKNKTKKPNNAYPFFSVTELRFKMPVD